jgi:hypothetical protein
VHSTALTARFHVGGNGIDIIVAYLLKTRTVEPEKQLLLANGSETTRFKATTINKQVPVAMVHTQQ